MDKIWKYIKKIINIVIREPKPSEFYIFKHRSPYYTIQNSEPSLSISVQLKEIDIKELISLISKNYYYIYELLYPKKKIALIANFQNNLIEIIIILLIIYIFLYILIRFISGIKCIYNSIKKINSIEI